MILIAITTSSGELRRFSFDLTDGAEIRIGRDEGCDIALPQETFLSRVHCIISYTNGQMLIQDNRSSNGVYLQGSRIISDELVMNAEYKIGDCLMVASESNESPVAYAEEYAQPTAYPTPGYPQEYPQAYPQQPQAYPQAYPQQPPTYPQAYPQQPQAYPQAYPQQPPTYPQAYPQQPQAYPQAYPQQPPTYPQAYPQQPQAYPQAYPQQPPTYPQAYPQQPQEYPQAYPQAYPQQPQEYPQAYPQAYPQQPQEYPQAYPQAYPQQPQEYPQAYPQAYPQQPQEYSQEPQEYQPLPVEPELPPVEAPVQLPPAPQPEPQPVMPEPQPVMTEPQPAAPVAETPVVSAPLPVEPQPEPKVEKMPEPETDHLGGAPMDIPSLPPLNAPKAVSGDKKEKPKKATGKPSVVVHKPKSKAASKKEPTPEVEMKGVPGNVFGMPCDFELSVRVTAAAHRFEEGAQLRFYITAERECRVFLISHDSAGGVELLMPNEDASENLVFPSVESKFPNPGSNQKYEFAVEEPFGREAIVALAVACTDKCDFARFLREALKQTGGRGVGEPENAAISIFRTKRPKQKGLSWSSSVMNLVTFPKEERKAGA